MKKYVWIGALFFLILLTSVLLYYFEKKPKAEQIPSDYKGILSLSEEGTEIALYSKDGKLDVGKNSIYVFAKPAKKLKELYFYMPPMPGMGEMREDASIKEVFPGVYLVSVNISMAGSWQIVLGLDGKVIKKDISVPFTAERKARVGGNKIAIDPSKLQLIGIQTDVVKRMDVTESFFTVGYVSYDSSRVYQITVRSDGWILDTFERFEGELIKRGTPLMKVLNPDVNIAKEELRLSRDMGRKDLERAVLEKLSYLKSGDIVRSPYDGVILEKRVYNGGSLKAGDVAYKIADISRVWVIAEVPQESVGVLRKGMEVIVSPVGEEDSFMGRVDYVFPEADRMSRTIKARVSLANRDVRLKVNQMVNVYFEKHLANVLALPEDAVVDTGRRKIVFVEIQPGEYEPRAVKLGRRAQGYYQLLDGLREGDRVVIKGNFLLDSEAQ
ncbi:MAG: efflux RND transporter periplasmic adaptor subunit, partial [Aquificaceae bacterium]